MRVHGQNRPGHYARKRLLQSLLCVAGVCAGGVHAGLRDELLYQNRVRWQHVSGLSPHILNCEWSDPEWVSCQGSRELSRVEQVAGDLSFAGSAITTNQAVVIDGKGFRVRPILKSRFHDRMDVELMTPDGELSRWALSFVSREQEDRGNVAELAFRHEIPGPFRFSGMALGAELRGDAASDVATLFRLQWRTEIWKRFFGELDVAAEGLYYSQSSQRWGYHVGFFSQPIDWGTYGVGLGFWASRAHRLASTPLDAWVAEAGFWNDVRWWFRLRFLLRSTWIESDRFVRHLALTVPMEIHPVFRNVRLGIEPAAIYQKWSHAGIEAKPFSYELRALLWYRW